MKVLFHLPQPGGGPETTFNYCTVGIRGTNPASLRLFSTVFLGLGRVYIFHNLRALTGSVRE